MKECSECKSTLNVDMFYKRSDTGRLYGKCISCFNAANSKRNSTEEGKLKIRERRVKSRHKEINRIRERKSSKVYRDKYPEKELAKRKVRDAIRRGELVRPARCQACHKTSTRQDGVTSIQAHHADYSKPLEVKWLCPPCHAKEHNYGK